jgi:hypothetical protein
MNILRWVRDHEPAIAAGLVGSGVTAAVNQIVSGEVSWQDGMPLVVAALVRFFVYKPDSVVVAKATRTVKQVEVYPGPGAVRANVHEEAK